MTRPALSVDLLEDRTTPASVNLAVAVAPASASTPPQDPMDNPPPTQPGTPVSPGSGTSGTSGTSGSSTGPSAAGVAVQVPAAPAFSLAFTLPRE